MITIAMPPSPSDQVSPLDGAAPQPPQPPLPLLSRRLGNNQ